MPRAKLGPVFKLWLDDWRGSLAVRTMSFAERGAYLELLTWCYSFGGEGVPSDDRDLASLMGRPLEEWLSVRDPVIAQFDLRNGRYHNRKVQKLIDAEESYKRRSENMNRQRWNRKGSVKGSVRGSVKGSVKGPSPSPSPSSSSSSSPSPSGMDVDGGPPTLLPGADIDWSLELQRWNALAAEHDLPRAEKWNPARRAKLKQRLREHPDFWRRVSEKLATRGEWARNQRIPSLDQVLQQSTCQRLLEGNYDGTTRRFKHSVEIEGD